MPKVGIELTQVSILIKTFLRDFHLFDTLDAIITTMPDAQLIVVDDGDSSPSKKNIYTALRAKGHIVLEVPFDMGFGFKSNLGAQYCERPYLLIGSDDFDFRPPAVREGIEKLVRVLNQEPSIAIASGRVNCNPYEGWLIDHGSEIIERYIKFDNPQYLAKLCVGDYPPIEYHHCNLTVNYSLIRRSILGRDKIHWDDDVKIGGGEHGAFFVDVMRAGHNVCYVTGVNINEQHGKITDPRYPSFRARAHRPQRECFTRRGIHEYVCFGGSVEKA